MATVAAEDTHSFLFSLALSCTGIYYARRMNTYISLSLTHTHTHTLSLSVSPLCFSMPLRCAFQPLSRVTAKQNEQPILSLLPVKLFFPRFMMDKS